MERTRGGALATLDGQSVLRVTYAKGEVGSRSGMTGVYASPSPWFPSDALELRYAVKFAPGFDFVLGGKLPGLQMGSTASAHGGDYSSGAASARIMWREGGQAEVYAYPASGAPRSAAFRAVARDTGMGLSMWRGFASFRAGVWNTVRLRVRLNTPGKEDGSVGVWVNGTGRELSGMAWRGSKPIQLTAITLDTFFGGSEKRYAPPADQTASFAGFGLSQA